MVVPAGASVGQDSLPASDQALFRGPARRHLVAWALVERQAFVPLGDSPYLPVRLSAAGVARAARGPDFVLSSASWGRGHELRRAGNVVLWAPPVELRPAQVIQ